MAAPLLAGAARFLGLNTAKKTAPKKMLKGNYRAQVIDFTERYKKALQEKETKKPFTKNPFTEGALGEKSENFEVDGQSVKKILDEPSKKNDLPLGVSSTFKKLNSLPKNIAKLPRVGSIGLLLFLIIFILFAIQRTEDGETRFSLFWKTMLGRTSITDENITGEASENANVLTGSEEEKKINSLIIDSLLHLNPVTSGVGIIKDGVGAIQGALN